MCTVPEVIAAKHLQLPCVAVSVVKDDWDPGNLKPINIEEIIAVAKKPMKSFLSYSQKLQGSMSNNALIIFVKNLIEGSVKTRLADTLGSDAAMDIYKQLLKNVHDKIKSLDTYKVVFYSDFPQDDIWENNLFQKEVQEGNDLGKRMEKAFENLFTKGYKKSIIIGTDCPGINRSLLENAFEKLDDSDIVIGPAIDGGYYLLGMKKEYPFLFRNIEWSTDRVLQQTIVLCQRNQLSYFLLPELSDIDEEKDLIHFENLMMPKDKIS